MTIAACYLSPEGVVFGADSTASTMVQAGPGTLAFHFFNHNQKLFQVGEDGTLGIVTWGLGGLGSTSHRTLIAQLADDLEKKTPADLNDVATRWATLFWNAYSAELQSPALGFQALKAKTPYVPPPAAPLPTARTKAEEDTFQALSRDLTVGFCLGGYALPNRTPGAFVIIFDPNAAGPPTPAAVAMQSIQWFGVPNLILRLINGYDISIPQNLLKSGKWTGTPKDLSDILDQHRLAHSTLPIRDAIDYVFTSIYSTIKAMKFSSLCQVCGGPIELAVVTSDRNFRWVRHKSWDSAIEES